MTDFVQLDLGVADVHVPGAIGGAKRTKTMAQLDTKTRNALPSGTFALPKQRKYPLENAAHVRNAAARLEQEHKAGKVSSTDYGTAKRAIARAAKKFGVESKFAKGKSKMRRLKIQADLADGGSLHVRHAMSARLAMRLDTVALALDKDDASKPVWIQLARPGAFVKGGKRFEMNSEIFSQIIKNFEATSNHEIPVDYEHASVADAGDIATTGAPAQGWIREMRIESGNLMGLVAWGPRAREQIKAGEYKYFSPVVVFGAKDRKTGADIGASMPCGAMTNIPFLDGMKPLAAKDEAVLAASIAIQDAGAVLVEMRMSALAHAPGEYMPRLKACLRLPELSSAQECADHMDKLRDHVEACGGNPLGTHEGIDLSEYTMGLRNLTGAPPGATWDDVFDIVDKLIEAAIEEHVVEDHGGQASSAAMDDDEGGEEMTQRHRAAAALRMTLASA